MFKDKYKRDMENVTPSRQAVEKTRERMQNCDNVKRRPFIKTKQVIAAAVCFCLLVGSVFVGMRIFSPSDNGKYKDFENPYVKVPDSVKIVNSGNAMSLSSGVNYDDIFSKLEKAKVRNPYLGGVVTDNLVTGAPKDSNAESTKPSQANTNHSDTNNQVSGVQEADIVKTDGKYIYACGRTNQYAGYYDKGIAENPGTSAPSQYTTGKVNILSVDNGIISPVSVIKIRQNADDAQYILSEILLYEDTLILIKTGYKIIKTDNSEAKYYGYYYNNALTSAEVYNIKDRANPVFVNELYQSGSYNSCRMIGNYLYIITNHYVYNPQKDKPETYIPYCSSYSSDYLVPAGCIYVAEEVTAANYTVITGIDVKNPANHVSNAAVLGFSGTVYSSLDNIYIAAYRYNSNFYSGFATDTVVTNEGTVDVKPAPSASTATSGAAEPGSAGSGDTKPTEASASQGQTEPAQAPDYSYGITATYDNSLTEDDASAAGKPLTLTNGSTDIYRFSVKDGVVTYNATGRVDGTLLNQFCMDEYEGNFRIATTVYEYSLAKYTYGDKANYFYNQSTYYNNVYVLDKDLKTIGTISKMAPNEKIYSVRFDGTIGYVVTFRQTDPLFAIDLSDAKAPKQLSALKIPGFSTYMHPFGQNLLFGFGKDADENGRTKGLKLSMFDVTNKADVKEAASLKLGGEYSYSEAMYNHKAILVDSQKNLIGFPVQIYDYNSSKWGYSFYKYENGNFVEAASIYNGNGSYSYFSLRGFYIGDYVYIYSENQSVTSYKLSDFSMVSSYDFPLE